MKTKIRRVVSLCLCALLLLTTFLSMKADALVVIGNEAGIYGHVSGTCVQDTNNAHMLHTTTRVTVNPDNAYLRTDIELLDGLNDEPDEDDREEFWSEDRGIKLFTYDYIMNLTITTYPEIAYCAHNVLRGTDSLEGYAYHEYIEIVWPEMGVD